MRFGSWAAASRGRCALRDEAGQALILALGVLTVAAIMATTVLWLTSASYRDARRSDAGGVAYALAEGGMADAFAVLSANYPGTVPYPGDPTLLPARTSTYSTGSATWSGSLVAVTGQAWSYEWDVKSTGSVRNPTGPKAGLVTRTATATVPVILPPTQPNSGSSPLNWIYAGTDVTLSQSLLVSSPVYAVGNLTLANSARIAGAAGKIAVGGNLTLTTSQNQIGLTGGSDPRLAEAHVVGRCSVKTNVALHDCGGSSSATNWDSDSVYASSTSHSLTGLIDHQPSLTCCAPVAGTLLPAGSATVSDMGFWYKNADLGPLHHCSTGSVPFQFDSDSTINNSVTPVSPINLTPAGGSYSCSTSTGTLSWDSTNKKLTVAGTIFIDGSATIDSAGYSGNPVFTYSGIGTIILSGTFAMKGAKICAVTSASDCNWDTTAWNPNQNVLMIIADGDGGNGGAQSQANVAEPGYGIELVTGSSFQGALIANKGVKTGQSATQEGPMISIYSLVDAGQSGTLSFPAINLASTSATGISDGTIPGGQLLPPRNFGG